MEMRHLNVKLNCNSLHFIQGDLVAGAVVELRGTRRLVRCDCLGVLDRAS
jgi:hypothetical protein